MMFDLFQGPPVEEETEATSPEHKAGDDDFELFERPPERKAQEEDDFELAPRPPSMSRQARYAPAFLQLVKGH